MSNTKFLNVPFKVFSSAVEYNDDEIISNYSYVSSVVEGNMVYPMEKNYVFKTQTCVPNTGVMLVGWGGNNGSTFTAGILANKHKLSWCTKDGSFQPNYYGSITQSSTVHLGQDKNGELVYTPLSNLLPMVNPNDLVIGGWDISSTNLADAMKRSRVIDLDLQKQLRPFMETMVPLPSIYYEDFIASNQNDRADNVLGGTKQENLEMIRKNIRDFRTKHSLEKVLILWTANTERFSEIKEGVNDTAENLLGAIRRGENEVAPSTIFAVASILEGCTFINGSPQNTFVPGVLELAEEKLVMIAGDDFKSGNVAVFTTAITNVIARVIYASGQTKLKSLLVDMLVSAGLKPVSIVSYNHLGNNDGKNLSAPEQFRSKEISKSGVVEDMVASNRILYKTDEHPDHCVVIKYVPYVADSKRAMDEYTSEIFMNGKNTIVVHNTCEDSLLATPLIIDLLVLAELLERIEVRGVSPLVFAYERLHPVLSILSYLLKAPVVPRGSPVINALGAQRQCIVNFLMGCIGLPPENFLLLEHKISSEIDDGRKRKTDGMSNGQYNEDKATKVCKVLSNGSEHSVNGTSNGHSVLENVSKKMRVEL